MSEFQCCGFVVVLDDPFAANMSGVDLDWTDPVEDPTMNLESVGLHESLPELSAMSATPGRSGYTPGRPSATPGRPNATPGRPNATPGRPNATPGRPSATPGRPNATPGRPNATPGRPSYTPSRPSGTPGRPSFMEDEPLPPDLDQPMDYLPDNFPPPQLLPLDDPEAFMLEPIDISTRGNHAFIVFRVVLFIWIQAVQFTPYYIICIAY